MKTHYTLENLNEVKIAFSKEGEPHLNGTSTLVVNMPSQTVTLIQEESPGKVKVTYQATLKEVIEEAMDQLGIKVSFADIRSAEESRPTGIKVVRKTDA